MFCSNCSQPVRDNETKFCSYCGAERDATRESLVTNGLAISLSTTGRDKLTPRHQGMRQGVGLMLLSLILVPAFVLLAPLFPANDRLVESAVSDTPFEKISQVILLTLFLLGLVRTLYAWFFQRGPGSSLASEELPKELGEAPGNPV